VPAVDHAQCTIEITFLVQATLIANLGRWKRCMEDLAYYTSQVVAMTKERAAKARRNSEQDVQAKLAENKWGDIMQVRSKVLEGCLRDFYTLRKLIDVKFKDLLTWLKNEQAIYIPSTLMSTEEKAQRNITMKNITCSEANALIDADTDKPVVVKMLKRTQYLFTWLPNSALMKKMFRFQRNQLRPLLVNGDYAEFKHTCSRFDIKQYDTLVKTLKEKRSSLTIQSYADNPEKKRAQPTKKKLFESMKWSDGVTYEMVRRAWCCSDYNTSFFVGLDGDPDTFDVCLGFSALMKKYTGKQITVTTFR
jgi:hypothetical protein